MGFTKIKSNKKTVEPDYGISYNQHNFASVKKKIHLCHIAAMNTGDVEATNMRASTKKIWCFFV